MAGHSKWSNIKHRKERVDNKRGRVFSRVVKEIYVAVKIGGVDPSANPRLRVALQKAKEVNLPKDNIDKALKRGSGQLVGASYEQIRYEGYGPDGVALIVDCFTDNRNRTTSEIRHAFSRCGGNLGTDGSVAFLFERVGQLLYAPSADADAIVTAAIEAGAADFAIEADDSVEVITTAEDFLEVVKALDQNHSPDAAELIMRAHNPIAVAAGQTEKIQRLLDALEDCDDTQQVHTNAQFAS